jgi:hypothetical protein
MGLAAALVLATAAQITVAAATAAEERYLAPPGDGEWEIDAIEWTPATAVSTHNTDYHTVTCKRNASGSTVATWNTTITSGAAYVKGTAIRATLVPAYTRFTGGVGGDVLEIGVAKSGSGAIFDVEFKVTWRKCQSDS